MTELIAKAKELLAEIEVVEHEVLTRADETQLRIAVARLVLFVEHLAHVEPSKIEQPPKASTEPKPKTSAPKAK